MKCRIFININPCETNCKGFYFISEPLPIHYVFGILKVKYFLKMCEYCFNANVNTFHCIFRTYLHPLLGLYIYILQFVRYLVRWRKETDFVVETQGDT